MGKFVHNTTFMMVADRAVEFVEWVRPLVESAARGMEPRLSVLRYVGGAPAGEEEGMSVALQVEGDSIEDLLIWADRKLRLILLQFEKRYQGITFSSIFENLSLGAEEC